MNLKSAFAFAFVVSASSTASAAIVLTYDTLPTNRVDIVEYAEDGFVTTHAGGLYKLANRIQPWWANTVLSISRADGGEFSLLSLELYTVSFQPRDVTVFGDKADGSFVTQVVSLTPGYGVFATTKASFNAGFSELTAVRFIQGVDDGVFRYNNVVLELPAAVPEPSSVILAGAALFGLAFSRRRRPLLTTC